MGVANDVFDLFESKGPVNKKQKPYNVGAYGNMPRNRGYGRTGSPSLKGYNAPTYSEYSMVPVDTPYSDQNIMQLRAAGLTAQEFMPVVPMDVTGMPSGSGSGNGSGSGSGSGRGSRGSGGGVSSAYQQMLDALNQENAAVLSGFDARQRALDEMARAETERNAGIQAGLLSAASQARQQVGESYSQGARSLQDLAAQYGQMIAGRQPAAEQTLQAFGASGAVSSPQQVQDMLVAQQAALGRQGQSYDALLAGRPEMYSALNAEQEAARARQADLVRAQLLAARQQADAQAARERAQLALQMQR